MAIGIPNLSGSYWTSLLTVVYQYCTCVQADRATAEPYREPHWGAYNTQQQRQVIRMSEGVHPKLLSVPSDSLSCRGYPGDV